MNIIEFFAAYPSDCFIILFFCLVMVFFGFYYTRHRKKYPTTVGFCAIGTSVFSPLLFIAYVIRFFTKIDVGDGVILFLLLPSVMFCMALFIERFAPNGPSNK